jgi:hypothetical protein
LPRDRMATVMAVADAVRTFDRSELSVALMMPSTKARSGSDSCSLSLNSQSRCRRCHPAECTLGITHWETVSKEIS